MRKGYEIKKELYRGYMCWLVFTPTGKTYEIERWQKRYFVTILPDYPNRDLVDKTGRRDKKICTAYSKGEAIEAIYASEENINENIPLC